jgi:hypothetical protein
MKMSGAAKSITAHPDRFRRVASKYLSAARLAQNRAALLALGEKIIARFARLRARE